jgi:Lamin Tail Domain
MKKIFTLLALFISILANSQSTTVVISQVYGGGGATTGSSTYKNDYVELHNISAVSQDITGFKLMYGSAVGQFASAANNSFTFPSTTVIPAGGYLLIQTGPTGTVGAVFPVAADLTTANLTMSGASGKIALVNSTFPINTCGATATPCNVTQLNSFIDWVAFGAAGNGSAGNGEGGTSANNGVALSVTQGCVRKTNGCQDTDNNNNDFTITTNPVPRNSTSPVVTCSGPVPTISATPNISNITTSVGVASVSQSFNLSASNLTPAAGNLSIAPSTGLEISFDNTAFFSTAQNFAYTGSAVASTPIYVRISAAAAQGALVGATVTTSGGGAASNAVLTVAGSVSQNFYSQPTGDLATLATWGIATNGTGTAPASFTSPYQIFIVTNRTNAIPGAHWEVTGTGSKLIIGDGINPVTVSTSLLDSLKAITVVDILNNGTLEMGSRIAPTFGTLAVGSTVNYNFNGTTVGTDTVKINVANYHNLSLTNGLKYFKSGITTVNGDLLFDGTIGCNGAGTPFSTISLKKNLSMQNDAVIDDTTTTNGFANRFTLSLAGNNDQVIYTGTSELRIFRLIRDTIASLASLDIRVSSNSKITMGNMSTNGGGLSLFQKVGGATSTTKLLTGFDTQLAIVGNGTIFTEATKTGSIGATNSRIIINKSILGTANAGTLKFLGLSSLNNLTINISTTAKDTVNIASKIKITGTLNLTKGVIVMGAAQDIEFSEIGTSIGGSAISYVDGRVKKFFNPSTTFVFPIGQNKQYAPVEITAQPDFCDYTAQYFKQAYSTLAVNTTTTSAIPSYTLSNKEYWNINQSVSGAANIKFYYNTSSLVNATLARIAHFNNVDWDDIGRDGNGTDGVGNYILKNTISTFSPFTFGGTAAVLPIILQSFNGSLLNNNSTLQWKTSCEGIGDAFELQYSTNGINFATIYSTNAVGDCNGVVYNYVHKNATASVNYYRLLLKSVDGRTKNSNILTLKNSKLDFESMLQSTVVKDQLVLSITSPINGLASVIISNLLGQQLYNKNIAHVQGTQLNYIPVEKLTSGMYLLSIKNNNGEVNTIKFIKN